jgi:hypothetical protein
MFKNEIIERNKNIKRNFSVVFDFILFIYNLYNFYFLLLLYIMAKSRKNRSLSLKSVNSGLTSVGRVAKGVAKKSMPIINKSVSAVYDTMGKGFDLGVQSIKSLNKRSRKIAGGRRRRGTRRR